MTSGAAAMFIFGGLLFVAALLLLLWALEDALVQRTRGGYRSSGRSSKTYRKPPAGPAPGAWPPKDQR